MVLWAIRISVTHAENMKAWVKVRYRKSPPLFSDSPEPTKINGGTCCFKRLGINLKIMPLKMNGLLTYMNPVLLPQTT